MRGYCSRCGREIGGFLKPAAWQCVMCRVLFCEACTKERVGLLFKKPVCPRCRVELRQAAFPYPNGRALETVAPILSGPCLPRS